MFSIFLLALAADTPTPSIADSAIAACVAATRLDQLDVNALEQAGWREDHELKTSLVEFETEDSFFTHPEADGIIQVSAYVEGICRVMFLKGAAAGMRTQIVDSIRDQYGAVAIDGIAANDSTLFHVVGDGKPLMTISILQRAKLQDVDPS